MNVRADRFPLFDALRAIAALSILVFHSVLGGYNGLPSALRESTARLDVGLALFFVISGFLLYRPFVRARFSGWPMPYVRAYAWRRFLRIVPAYWVALIVVTLWFGTSHVVFTASGIPTYFGFLQVYSNSTTLNGIGQAWTLCVEVTFYISLPLWALAVRARRRVTLASELVPLAVLFLAGAVYLVWALHRNGAHEPSPYFKTLPAYMDQFALGMAMAVLSAWYETRERTAQAPRAAARLLARLPSAPWAVAAIAFAVVVAVNVSGHLGEYMFRHELYSLVAVGVIAPAVLFPEGRGIAGRVLGNRVLLLLGLWSYAIYLYHAEVILKLAKPVRDFLPNGAGWDTFGLAVIALVPTVVAAALSYYLVERPALSLKRRVGTPALPTPPTEAIAEPAPASPPQA